MLCISYARGGSSDEYLRFHRGGYGEVVVRLENLYQADAALLTYSQAWAVMYLISLVCEASLSLR